MAKINSTKPLAKPAKSLRKRSTVRAVPLSSGQAKKTTLKKRKPRAADRRLPADRVFETIEEIQARMPATIGKLEEPAGSGAESPPMSEPLPSLALMATPFEVLRGMTEATRAGITAARTGLYAVDAISRAERITSVSTEMTVRRQGRAFGMMLDVMRMQRQFFEMWRPRNR